MKTLPFPFTDFAWYPSMVINLSLEDDYTLRLGSPPSESLILGAVLGTPTLRINLINDKSHMFTDGHSQVIMP